jgi:trehalose/maltose transport system permease protein
VTTASSEKKGRSWFKEEFGNPERRTAYYMVLPSLLIIVVVAFFPVLYGIVLSLTDSTVSAFGSFVGLENYTEMFQDPDFRVSLTNTVIFTVVSVALEFIIGLGIALAVNRAFRGRGLVRAAILVPWAFPTVISAVMWRLMFQPGIGIFQYVGETIGIISRPVLSDPTLLLIAAILIDVWKTTPFMALLLLAGLQVIPGEVYEAARVAALFPHNVAAAQGRHPGRRPLPYPRRLPGLRPVLGVRRSGAPVLEHVRLRGREDQPASVWDW